MVRVTIISPPFISMKHELAARDTKLGPEEVTREIPNVSEDVLRESR